MLPQLTSLPESLWAAEAVCVIHNLTPSLLVATQHSRKGGGGQASYFCSRKRTSFNFRIFPIRRRSSHERIDISFKSSSADEVIEEANDGEVMNSLIIRIQRTTVSTKFQLQIYVGSPSIE